jgi:hypothetical protein
VMCKVLMVVLKVVCCGGLMPLADEGHPRAGTLSWVGELWRFGIDRRVWRTLYPNQAGGGFWRKYAPNTGGRLNL